MHHQPPPFNNTRQLFATHSLSELAAIASKLRSDSNKKDAFLASTLAEAYTTLISSTDLIELIRTSTLQLHNANIALNQWAPTATPPLLPDTPVQTHHELFLDHLDQGWSAQCSGDFVHAIHHFDHVNQSSATPSLLKTTINESKHFFASEFIHNKPISLFDTADTSMQHQYLLVQDYFGTSLATTFLDFQRSCILSVLAPPTESSIDRAIQTAIFVENLGPSLNIPTDTMDAWITTIRHDLSTWIKKTEIMPSHLEVNEAWAFWLQHVHHSLYQSKVHSFLRELQSCIVNKILPTLNKSDPDILDVPQLALSSFKKSACALIQHPYKNDTNLDFFKEQAMAFIDRLADLYRLDIETLVRSLHAAGYVFETWDAIHAKCESHILQWTRDFMTDHIECLREPSPLLDKPSSGIVRFLFQFMARMQESGLMQFPTCTTKFLLNLSALVTEEHYLPQVHAGGDAHEIVLCDLALLDRVCGTNQLDQFASLDVGKLNSARKLADTAVQAWGLLLLVTPAGSAADDMHVEGGMDPCDCIGPQLPTIQVPKLISSIAIDFMNVSPTMSHSTSTPLGSSMIRSENNLSVAKSTEFIAAASLSMTKSSSMSSILKTRPISSVPGTGGPILLGNRVAQYLSRASSYAQSQEDL